MSMKLILTDCDGVLLDWEAAFEKWMSEQGYHKIDDYEVTAYSLHLHYGVPRKEIVKLIAQFNESARIGFLQPMRDSVEGISRLRKAGYKFVVITSLNDDPYANALRSYNLEVIFGVDAISEVICLPLGADKDKELASWVKYNPVAWVEDKYENAIAGRDLGIPSFLMRHDHNNHRDHEGLTIVDDWYMICEKLIGDNVS